MNESESEVARRDELLRMYAAMKEALAIIGDVTSNTTTEPTPPPVDNEWLQPESDKGGGGGGGLPRSNGPPNVNGAALPRRPPPSAPSSSVPPTPGARPGPPGESTVLFARGFGIRGCVWRKQRVVVLAGVRQWCQVNSWTNKARAAVFLPQPFELLTVCQ